MLNSNITKNLHIIVGVGVALLVPGELGIKVLAGGVAAGATRALLLAHERINADKVGAESAEQYEEAQNLNVVDTLLFVGAGALMALPTVVNPVFSLIVKVAIFTLYRRGLHDFSVATYGKSPFSRFSFEINATSNDGGKEFNFAI